MRELKDNADKEDDLRYMWYIYIYIYIDCIEHKGCMSKYNTFEKNEFLTSNAREKYKIVKESYFIYVIVYFFQLVIM